MARNLLPTLDELTEDQGDGYTVARHLLDELATEGPLEAAELGRLVGDLEDGRQVGAWLRHLRAVHGWVDKTPISPASTRVRWRVTDAGLAYLAAGAEDRS